MEWLTCVKSAISFMEKNLLTIQSVEEVAEYVHISPMYLQKGFQVITGYTVGEYIRNRKLYNAALEIVRSEDKIIDIAYQYGYETPESFTKAFTRFHGATPLEVRKNRYLMKAFHPLRINIVIQGGEKMDYVIQKRESFKVIGFSKEFSYEISYSEIPKFWDVIFAKYANALFIEGKAPENAVEQAVYENRIGKFGVCIDDIGKDGKFRYMIAGRYRGGDVPEGMEVYELPECEWARFKCIGPMPDSMQSVNIQIWKEWLPGNEEYELAGKFNVEWYSSEGSTMDDDYESEIWIPVSRK